MRRALILAAIIYPGVACCALAQVIPLPKKPPRSFGEMYTMYKDLEQAVDLDTKGRKHLDDAEYAKAKELFLKSLEIKRKYCEDDHPIVATSYSFLSALYLQIGNPVRAEEYSRLFLDSMRRASPRTRYPKGSEGLLKAIANHAAILEVLGEYIESEQLHREALEMRRQLHLEPRNLDVAINLGNIASVLFQRGEYGAAEQYARDALKASKKLPATPENQRQLSRAYGNLAETLRSQRKPEEAQENQKSAINILRKLFPKGHPSLALSIRNLALVLADRGLENEAVEQFREALRMTEASFPPDQSPNGHVQTLQLLEDLGRTYAQAGQLEKAGHYNQRALRMARALYPPRSFPDGHPELSRCLSNVGSGALRGADPSKAAPLFREALNIEHKLTTRLATLLSEAEALNLLRSRPAQLSGLLSATADQPIDIRDYRFVWQSKSSLMRILERRRLLLLASKDAETAKLAVDLNEARRELARELLAPATVSHAVTLEKLTTAKENLERRLAQKLHLSKSLGGEDREETPENLRNVLPQGHAFVDFLYYYRLEPASVVFGSANRQFVPHYAAFIVTRDRPVVRVELGEAERIHQVIFDWRRAIAADSGKEREAARRVGKVIWDQVRAELPAEGIKTVYLAPDGALTLVPFVALPGRDPKKILLEEHAVAFVPHGPFLTRRLKEHRVPPVADKARKVLVVGDVAYDTLPSMSVKRGLAARMTPAIGDKQLRWKQLTATPQELRRVADLAANALKIKPITRSREQASVDQILIDLPGTRFAHFATHGFFADASFRSAMKMDKQLFASSSGSSGGIGARSPLVLSGLVFAGANRRDTGSDRGILTAEGIIGLRLEGMELATLSACNTGLGEVAEGEGVFGLTRAFHLAGSKNVIASLWKVDDKATAALMGLFYEHLWASPKDTPKLSPLEALRHAQLYIYRNPGKIEELAKRGSDDYPEVPLPRPPQPGTRSRTELWAGFVLSGSGR